MKWWRFCILTRNCLYFNTNFNMFNLCSLSVYTWRHVTCMFCMHEKFFSWLVPLQYMESRIGVSRYTYRIHFQVSTRMYQSRSYLSILPDSSLTFAWQALLHVMVNSLAQIHRCKPWQIRQITYPTRSCTCIQGEPEKIQRRLLPEKSDLENTRYVFTTGKEGLQFVVYWHRA